MPLTFICLTNCWLLYLFFGLHFSDPWILRWKERLGNAVVDIGFNTWILQSVLALLLDALLYLHEANCPICLHLDRLHFCFSHWSILYKAAFVTTFLLLSAPRQVCLRSKGILRFRQWLVGYHLAARQLWCLAWVTCDRWSLNFFLIWIHLRLDIIITPKIVIIIFFVLATYKILLRFFLLHRRRMRMTVPKVFLFLVYIVFICVVQALWLTFFLPFLGLWLRRGAVDGCYIF